jgi:hypothetical protein
MGLTQAHIQIVPQLFPPGVKRQEREWDHLPRSSVNFENGRLQLYTQYDSIASYLVI